MKNKSSNEKKYKTISEVAKELHLVDKKTGRLQTHTIRYWEKQFKHLKPIILSGRRRYYSDKNIKKLTHVKSLLKEKGLTINGVKKILQGKEIDTIDDSLNFGVYNSSNNSTKIIKDKLKNISKIIKELKDIKNG